MKDNELRIGNFIIESLPFGSDKVIKVDPNIFNRRIDEFIPITLTEEWLLKFGFEKDGEDLILDTNLFLLVSYNDDEFVHLKSNHLETITSVKYVHQLQNLYFALTGEELTFKSE